jgi:phosphomannomutase/phosphoglucomutase
LTVAQKKTALQIAQQGNRATMDGRRLGLSALFGLSLGLAVACLLQAVIVARKHSDADTLDQSRRAAAQQIERLVATQQEALRTALDDDELRLALNVVDDAGRQRAQVRLRERLPAAVRADFYAPELPELLSADLAAFGYARANVLADARSNSGVARAQAHKDQDGTWRLALAQAVRGGERNVAYAYVTLPADELLATVAAADPGGGRIELRQGAYGQAVLTSVGDSGAASDEHADVVPGSIFSVATLRPEMFEPSDFFPVLDTDSVGWLVFWTLFFGALAVAAVWVRRGMASGAGLMAALGAVVQRQPKADAVAATSPPPPAPAEPKAPAAPAKPAPAAAPSAPAPAAPDPRATAIDRSIFRAYDIRGVIGKTLTNATARMIGHAVGTLLRERGLTEIVVARDGRLSGPQLAAELIKGLRAAGADVIDIGAVPTPVLYFATFHLNAGSGVMVTGSHNPPEYNGFKIVVGGETLAEEAITDLYARIVEGKLATGSGGIQVMDVSNDYVERISGDVQVERRLKVVVDAGNGIAGGIAPQVLEAIGCEVLPLYCEVDGNFPNHHPDPSDPENLADLIVTVKRLDADLGLAFDGDGDRLGVVTRNGEIIYPDRLLMLFAIDVLNRNPGAAIIYDVKCTGHLQDLILRHGGSPMMWKTGHSLIKAKMREEDAELAGEMSGHFFFRERWFGFDDGIYAAARLAEILGASDRKPQDVFDELPKGVSTPELKVPMQEGEHYAYIAKFRERAAFPGARVSTIDGVRADYPDGWGLVRCSNTTPNLVLRFDANDQAALTRIQETFRAQLLALDPTLNLPF